MKQLAVDYAHGEIDPVDLMSDDEVEIERALQLARLPKPTNTGGAKDFSEALHPRDREGQFADKPGSDLPPLPADAQFSWSQEDGPILQLMVPVPHTAGVLGHQRGRMELSAAGPDKFMIDFVYTSKAHRHEGTAEHLALEFHRKYPNATLLHGNYVSKAGGGWAKHMVEKYPDWNAYHPVTGHTYGMS